MFPTSLHRPLPLIGRTDLEVQDKSIRNEHRVLIKDPISLRYFLLPLWQFRVLESLDGQRSLHQIWNCLQTDRSLPTIDMPDIRRLLLELTEKGLIWSRRSGTSKSGPGTTDDHFQQLIKLLRNPFFIRFPGWNFGITLQRCSNWMGWIYHWQVLLICSSFVLSTGVFALINTVVRDQQFPDFPSAFSGQNLLCMWFVVGGLKVLHELSHGLACERFGAHCQSIGVALMFFSPCLYCDVTDAWMLKNKWHRILVSLAGMYVEIVLAAICFWLWWLSADGIFHDVCLQIALAGSVSTLLFNANPLLRYDGYYVLSDLWEIPNLQQRGKSMLRVAAARCLLGVRLPQELEDLGSKFNIGIGIYGLASFLYQIPLSLGLGLFLYEFAKSWNVAGVFWIFAILFVAKKFTHLGGWLGTVATKQRSRLRLGTFLSLHLFGTIGFILGLWNLPFSDSDVAPLFIEPQTRVPVYVETPGEFHQLFVRAGNNVDAGECLAVLKNIDLERQLVSLKGQLAIQQIDSRMGRAISDPAYVALVSKTLEATREQIVQMESKIDGLRLRTPVAGVLMISHRDASNPGHTFDRFSESDDQIQQFVGAFLERRTCLFEVIPDAKWTATLWVDQKQRQFIGPDQLVKVRLDALTDSTLRGIVKTVGQVDEPDVPDSIASYLARSSSDIGQPQPLYRVIVELENCPRLLRTGMRGTGHFDRPPLTLGAWLTNEFQELFVVK